MDTNIKPKVSIQMCTYNRAHFIEQAIESVLSQTFTDWELLILDDSSTDNTNDLISKYTNDKRIKYFKNEVNLGIVRNRNKGLNLSIGEYIAVLDSDDYWIDDSKLEKQIEFLDNNIEYALVGTNMRIVDENNVSLKDLKYPTSDKVIRSRMLIKNNFCHSSTLYRKNVAEKLGGYDNSLQLAEDYNLFLNIGINNKIANIDTFGVAYRKHSNQSYSNIKKIGLEIQDRLIEKYRKNYGGFYLAKFVNCIRKLIK